MGVDKIQVSAMYKFLVWALSIMVVGLFSYLTTTALANRERIIRVESCQQQYAEQQKQILDTQKEILIKIDSLNDKFIEHTLRTNSRG